jgi:hypothetical protein
MRSERGFGDLQDAHSAFEWQVPNFVEEERAPVCRFHPPDLSLVSARESSALIAKQLGLKKVCGKAPQLIAMNGWSCRTECAWMASAVNSSPVPDSPEINTDASVIATFRIELKSATIASHDPIMWSSDRLSG